MPTRRATCLANSLAVSASVWPSRALATKPRLVIADEPTANLDSQTGAAILALMRHMQRRYNSSFLFSSHDSAVIKEADDAIFIKDGLIQGVRRLRAASVA